MPYAREWRKGEARGHKKLWGRKCRFKISNYQTWTPRCAGRSVRCTSPQSPHLRLLFPFLRPLPLISFLISGNQGYLSFFLSPSTPLFHSFNPSFLLSLLPTHPSTHSASAECVSRSALQTSQNEKLCNQSCLFPVCFQRKIHLSRRRCFKQLDLVFLNTSPQVSWTSLFYHGEGV